MICYADGGGDGNICIITDKPYVTKVNVAGTHNEAEYGSLLWLLGGIGDYEHYIIRMDSQLVVYQMTGKYKARHPIMKAMRNLARHYIDKRGLHVTFEWVPREENLAGIHLEQWKKKRA